MDKVLEIIKHEYGKKFYRMETMEQIQIIKVVSENYIGAVEAIKKIRQNQSSNK